MTAASIAYVADNIWSSISFFKVFIFLKVKPKIRWWKLKETSCQEAFRQEVIRILGGKDGLPVEWDKTPEMLRKTAEYVLGVTSGKRKGDKETWWWNEEVQESIKEKKEQRKHGTK